MQDLNDKVTGSSLTAAEWNEVPSELQNIIENTGQVLASGDLNQVGKGVAQYAANGDFYTDSGAVNAYVLSPIGLKQAPTAYVDGMRIRFLPDNTNTGASTVNVASLGLKNIKTEAGADPAAGDISNANIIELVYSTTSGYFVIKAVLFATNAEAQAKTSTSKALTPSNLAALGASDTLSGLIEIATQAEVNALTDTTRAVTPGRMPIASETQQGIAERATQAEVTAGTDTTRFVTPATLAGKLGGSSITNFDAGSVLHISTETNTRFDVDAVIGSTFETIGPTGSGATNIWTAMDVMPATATAVLLSLEHQIEGSTNADLYQGVTYVRKNGSSSVVGSDTAVSSVRFYNRSGALERQTNTTTAWVAVDSNQVFEIANSATGTSVAQVQEMRLEGILEA